MNTAERFVKPACGASLLAQFKWASTITPIIVHLPQHAVVPWIPWCRDMYAPRNKMLQHYTLLKPRCTSSTACPKTRPLGSVCSIASCRAVLKMVHSQYCAWSEGRDMRRLEVVVITAMRVRTGLAGFNRYKCMIQHVQISVSISPQ